MTTTWFVIFVLAMAALTPFLFLIDVVIDKIAKRYGKWLEPVIVFSILGLGIVAVYLTMPKG